MAQYAVQVGMLSEFFFFFNDTATTEIYTLSLHDALPIYALSLRTCSPLSGAPHGRNHDQSRSEEHTSELQSHVNLVCRLLLEKKKAIDDTEVDLPGHRSHTDEESRAEQH